MKSQHQLATWLMWVAAAVTMADFGVAWKQLPDRMAVHFQANGSPNGWASRTEALRFGVGIVAIVLVIFTILSYAIRKSPAPAFVAWAMLAFFYVVLAVICYGNHQVLRYNLGHETTSSVRNLQARGFSPGT